jgi:hypothetical protein
MKLFECQHCGQPLYFENAACQSCGRRLGYLVTHETLSALEPEGEYWRALAAPGALYRLCRNAAYEACNWLVRVEEPHEYCEACRHNRTIPDLSDWRSLEHWRKIEVAKHRLFYSLLRLKLPLTTRPQDPGGLVLDFLSGNIASAPVMTGHSGGVITINVDEADDSERERQRRQMEEPYRTLLGHFRHEIAHYYWDKLIWNTENIGVFRHLFGDERRDYARALQKHYDEGPRADWQDRFISAYASVHPWEDFAETFAHYLHMIDTLETAGAFGLSVTPKLKKYDQLAAGVDFDPYHARLDRLIEAWLPLAFAVNSLNRSMGLADLYPFVLTPHVIAKFDFLHELIHSKGRTTAGAGTKSVLRAMIAGLKKKVGLPDSVF